MIRLKIRDIIKISVKNLQKEGVFPVFEIPEIKIEKPEQEIYGDYSTNIAMVLAKQAKKKPMETAENVKCQIGTTSPKGAANIKNNFFEKIEVVKPGFVNFFLSKEYLQKQVGEILRQKEKYGSLKIGKNKKINVEFISANPTGPLHIGNGRGAFFGDAISNILIRAGYKVTKEYYINDVGWSAQIQDITSTATTVVNEGLAKELAKQFKELPYYNTYLRDKILKLKPGEDITVSIQEENKKFIEEKLKIKFDIWFSEKSLYESREVDKSLNYLKKKGLAFEKEKALWFRSTEFGDDKDRVLVKANGEKTYLASDIAYMKNKFKRGFDYLIYIWGADHYGYVGRIKAAAEALGLGKEKVKIIIMQLVKLFSQGKEVRMSKRTGTYVTLDELINEVGLDAARFFFLTRNSESHLNFDLDLAKEQSEKNPVYYVQYAHARICAILRKVSGFRFQVSGLELLTHPSELGLIKQLIRLPEIVEDVANDYQVQRLPQYSLDLARAFHQFYRDCRVIPAPYRTRPGMGSEEKNLSQARLGLILATKIVLKNTLDLMGISSPEKM